MENKNIQLDHAKNVERSVFGTVQDIFYKKKHDLLLW